MTITIRIDTDNAAFDDDKASGAHTEIARLLAGIAARFDTDGPHDGPLMDINGNTVGTVTIDRRAR
jgi:hypothetical protein